MSITKFEQEKLSLREKIADEKSRHDKAMKSLRAELEEAEAGSNLIAAGLDDSKIAVAKTVITIRGLFEKGGQDRQSVIEDAIADLLDGGPTLKATAFNTKDYAHWYGQRSDHPYGLGPRHGSIVFGVGLHQRLRTAESPVPSDAEIDAAIYYLRNLTRIQATEAMARATAQTVQP